MVTKLLMSRCFARTSMATLSRRWLAASSGSASGDKKPHCVVGTIGHHGHGKTTLTAAITKILATKKLAAERTVESIDSTPDEKKRLMSMHATHIEYSTDKRHYEHTDCPGHVDYIKSMITGANQVDNAILVVAATDGTQEQTKEHLILARQLGIQNLIVFLNKIDGADKDMLELVEMDLREQISEIGFKGDTVPIIPGSALAALEGKNDSTGKQSVLKLLEVMDTQFPNQVRDLEKPFLLSVESVFSIQGRGTVVRGRLERGTVKKGIEVDVLGYGKKLKTSTTGVRMFDDEAEEGIAGHLTSLLLANVKRDDIKRGMVVVKSGTLKQCDQVEAQVYCLKETENSRGKPFMTGHQLPLISKTLDVLAELNFSENELFKPGDTKLVTIKLLKPVVLEEGQRIIIRDGLNTTATGIVTKVLPDMTAQERDKLAKGKTRKERDAAKEVYEKLVAEL